MTARWTQFLLIAAMVGALPASSQSRNRFALTAAHIARALSASGMPTDAEHVSLLTRVVATEPQPVLDVLSVEALGNRTIAEHPGVRLRVKLACHIPAKCLPFYAIVNSTPSTAEDVNALSRSALRSVHSEITMKAGTHATLMMDDQRSRILVAVVSLENGMVGHRIHVASPDHKQTYVGEVVNDHLLRGSF